jgi:hypothetical protein
LTDLLGDEKRVATIRNLHDPMTGLLGHFLAPYRIRVSSIETHGFLGQSLDGHQVLA